MTGRCDCSAAAPRQVCGSFAAQFPAAETPASIAETLRWARSRETVAIDVEVGPDARIRAVGIGSVDGAVTVVLEDRPSCREALLEELPGLTGWAYSRVDEVIAGDLGVSLELRDAAALHCLVDRFEASRPDALTAAASWLGVVFHEPTCPLFVSASALRAYGVATLVDSWLPRLDERVTFDPDEDLSKLTFEQMSDRLRARSRSRLTN